MVILQTQFASFYEAGNILGVASHYIQINAETFAAIFKGIANDTVTFDRKTMELKGIYKGVPFVALV